MKPVVLYVDDEQMVLESICRALHGEPYTVQTANTGENALEMLKNGSPSVIVTDMCMPSMDGNAFLTKAQEICPESVYMVLSAYSDIEKVMKAVNEQHVWRYITKPWQKEDLRLSIQNAIEVYQNRQERKDLFFRLEEKNKQLIELNTFLEDKVKERTRQLEQKNRILQMLVEDTDSEAILKEVCKAISEQLKASSVFIDVPFLNNIYSNKSTLIPPNLKEICNQTITDKKEKLTETELCIPLIKNNLTLGAILISKPQNVNELNLTDQYSSFISLVKLCLTQAWNLQEVDRLMEQIK